MSSKASFLVKLINSLSSSLTLRFSVTLVRFGSLKCELDLGAKSRVHQRYSNLDIESP